MRKLAQRVDNRRPIQLLLRWRWVVLAIAIPISLVIEIVEGRTHDLQFLDEVIIDGLVLPISTWAMLTFASQKIALQFDREEALERRRRFTQELTEYRDYSALTKFIVRFPATLLPLEQVSLFVHNDESAQLELVAEWRAVDSTLVVGQYRSSEGSEYTFILLHSNKQVGSLRLRYRLSETPDPNQIKFVSLLIPEIAQALALTLSEFQQAAQVYREAQAYERRRIMQELHDSLAQQVFYLHLGLDQMADENNELMTNDELQRKVISMRDVAADVYEQIRNNLSILRAWEQVNLSEAISDLARATAHQSGLSVDIDLQGEPGWLSPHTCEHVFGVVREGLNNVVKHARAEHVRLSLAWSSEQLTISLSDDGVGFDMTQHFTEGHYGLALMREAIEALQGRFMLTSRANAGTTVQVSIPLRPPEPSLRPRKGWSEQLRTSLDNV